MAGISKGVVAAPVPVVPFGQDGRSLTIYRTGQFVFRQGDVADSIFWIIRGNVKLHVTSSQGKDAVIAILGEADFFGEACLLSQSFRTATATCLTDTAVIQFEKAEMLCALHGDAKLSRAFIAHLLARNNRMEADLVDHVFNPSERRLARLLLLLAERAAVTERISQETLAEMIGTTRPRVSFFMNKFRKLGFIEYGDGLKVHSALLHTILRD